MKPPCWDWKENRLDRLAARMRGRYLYSGSGCVTRRRAILKRIGVKTMNSCPACVYGTRHTVREMREYHPLAGHGYDGERWTHPDLDPASRQQFPAGTDLALERSHAAPSGEGDGALQASAPAGGEAKS